ncbi:MAG: hypothetical protein U1E63_11005 [Burkholderiales bacterium]
MAKTMLLQVARVMFGALWGMGFAGGGYGAELPKKFEFSVTYFTNGALAPVVEFGEKQKAMGMDQTIMATNDKKEPFLNNMAAKCASLGLFGGEQTEGGGYCAFVDADGDKIYEKWTYSDRNTGKIMFSGGTGKFAGLECQGTWQRVVAMQSAAPGTFQAVGTKKGTCMSR